MAIAKVITADLQASVGGSYLQTRTTISGTTTQKTLQGVPVVGAPLVRWVDVFTDFSGEIPVMTRLTVNNRLFTITAITGGLARLMMYTFDPATGNATPVGRIQLTFPNLIATAHTIKGLRVDDSNPSAIKVFIATLGSVTANAGLFMANNISTSDFAFFGFPTLLSATGSNQKAVYLLEDPANAGNLQLNTVPVALALDRVNKLVYVHNGTAATHQYYVYDYNLTPDVPSQTCTVTTVGANAIITTSGAHGLSTIDQIVFSNTGGALPTGLVAGTVYWISISNFTANTFSVSTTAALAAVGTNLTISTAGTGTQSVQRGYGISGSCWKWKTGNLPSATGTLITINSEKYMTPAHSTNSGFPCLFFATTTNLYLGKASELTSGATTWPSLTTSNILGTPNQIIAPTTVLADWDESLDRAMYTTSIIKIVAKKVVNNAIESIFGELNNDYLEGVSQTDLITQFGAITVADMGHANGWMFLTGASTGQRGILLSNTAMQNTVDTSYVITKVLDTPNALSYVGVATSLQAPSKTTNPVIYYRTSGFGAATGGWTLLPDNLLMGSVTPAAQIQFKIEQRFDNTASANPPQMIECFLAYTSSIAMSDNWTGSKVNSSAPSASPFYVAFRLNRAYSSGTVPRMKVTVVDDSGAVSIYDTITHASAFSYTINNGTSWSALGTVPNTALTTELRLLISAPSGNPVTCGIQEY